MLAREGAKGMPKQGGAAIDTRAAFEAERRLLLDRAAAAFEIAGVELAFQQRAILRQLDPPHISAMPGPELGDVRQLHRSGDYLVEGGLQLRLDQRAQILQYPARPFVQGIVVQALSELGGDCGGCHRLQ